jgi:hypothetical protein
MERLRVFSCYVALSTIVYRCSLFSAGFAVSFGYQLDRDIRDVMWPDKLVYEFTLSNYTTRIIVKWLAI